MGEYNLPNDAVMLLSVINTKLRDYYRDFDALCEDMCVEKDEIIQKLEAIDYIYDRDKNQFI